MPTGPTASHTTDCQDQPLLFQDLGRLRVHAQQGGLCLVIGEPGTGKSVLKQTLLNAGRHAKSAGVGVSFDVSRSFHPFSVHST